MSASLIPCYRAYTITGLYHNFAPSFLFSQLASGHLFPTISSPPIASFRPWAISSRVMTRRRIHPRGRNVLGRKENRDTSTHLHNALLNESITINYIVHIDRLLQPAGASFATQQQRWSSNLYFMDIRFKNSVCRTHVRHQLKDILSPLMSGRIRSYVIAIRKRSQTHRRQLKAHLALKTQRNTGWRRVRTRDITWLWKRKWNS